ncbi:MAG: Do family serine endopeptidase [Alphaproteobacteria bacterium]
MIRFVKYFSFALLAIFSTATLSFARGVPDGFAELTTRLSPAVVNISTSQNIKIEDEVPAFPEGSPLERFNDFFGRKNNSGRVSKSLGSGFVIDAQGHIVTNNHVIEGSDVIEVIFPNGDTYDATLLGRDPSTDLALLKIDAGKDIPFVPFGDSDASEVGEWVIAIGNPFGYGGSVAAGIVSARNRQINHGNFDDFIQTDVAINKGNSGGPLFNMNGEVIGVNTAILSPTGYSVGISFSIPADLAQSVIKQLLEFGETRRASLGVSVQAVDKALAKSVRLPEPTGAIVTRVTDDSPAKKAGIKVSDIILQIDGQEVLNQRALFRMVAESKIGVPTDVTILRKRKRKTVSVTFDRLKEKVTKDDLARKEKEAEEADRVAMGISIEALTDEVRSKHKIKPEITGVRVVKVSSRSQAAGKILAGDIIEEVEFEAVATPQAFEDAIAQITDPNHPVTILVNRAGNYVFYSLVVS